MSSNLEPSNADSVMVISVTEQPPEYIIKKIIGTDILPSSVYKSFINGYEWKLDTKYYSATITLYSIQEKTDFDEDFCDNTQATIFYFDGKEPSSFENVLNWMPSLKDVASEVQLIICEAFDSDENYKKKVLNWCVENQYELIEINPPPESDEEEDDDDDGLFSKSKGFGRVIEALQAHTWSNLVMKDEIKPQNPIIADEQDIKSNPAASVSSSKASEDTSKKMKVDNDEILLEEQWLQKVLEQDDPEGESFEALFSKFASMKEKASGLNGEERKKYAEKVAIAFWKAMGGEDDEIAGLDDD